MKFHGKKDGDLFGSFTDTCIILLENALVQGRIKLIYYTKFELEDLEF